MRWIKISPEKVDKKKGCRKNFPTPYFTMKTRKIFSFSHSFHCINLYIALIVNQ